MISFKRHRRGITLIIVILLCLIVAGCNETDGSAQANNVREKITAVSVQEVTPRPIRDVLVLPGETEPLYDIRLAADLNGRVEWIGPQEGNDVREDDLIAKIDVSALKAALESAEASFTLADKRYERRKELFDRGVFAREELDRSLTERTQALNTLRRARVEYNRGFVRSPIMGVINKLHVDVGEYVGRGDPVADIVNVIKIKITVNVPEVDVRYLSEGQAALITVDAFPERSFTGTIEFVAYKADPLTKTFEARIIMFNQGRDVRPGMIARVHLLRRVITNALVAPLAALVDKGGERIVYIEKDGIIYARTVTIGIIHQDVVQIVSGLEAGDHLVVTGQTEVEEGMKVVVK